MGVLKMAYRIEKHPEFRDAVLFQLSPPHVYTQDEQFEDADGKRVWEEKQRLAEYVVVSAARLGEFGLPDETLVFPCDKDGENIDMLEIGGGRGYTDHARALSGMGYEVQPGPPPRKRGRVEKFLDQVLP